MAKLWKAIKLIGGEALIVGVWGFGFYTLHNWLNSKAAVQVGAYGTFETFYGILGMFLFVVWVLYCAYVPSYEKKRKVWI